MMLTKEQLNKFAERAGFGGNLRNTHRVKLELFAKMVEAATEERVMVEMKKEQP
jgi:hypothetical protein